MSYLSIAEFRTRTIMPQSDVDELEAREPGFLAAAIADNSQLIDSRLRKRYAVPFKDPFPLAVKRWLTHLVTREAYFKRGMNPSAEQDLEAIIQMANNALDELRQAADAHEGLFDLPLRADKSGSGIVYGGPQGYSEASPYTWQDCQMEAIRYGRG